MYLENKVDQSKFYQFFAVHELEAWLLSDSSIFPANIRTVVKTLKREPEKINNKKPPAKLLNEIYRKQTGRNYKKVTQGKALFSKLDPNIAYNKCPYLKKLLDSMLELAQATS